MTERGRTPVLPAVSWAGAAFVLGGAITLASALMPVPALALLPSALPALLVLIGAVLLTAQRGGVTGASRVGATALVAFGGLPLLDDALGRLLVVPSGVGLVVGMSLVWLTAVGGVAAAAAVRRAAVLTGPARWVLWLPAGAFLVCALMETIPLGDVTLTLTAWDVGLLLPAAFVLAGIAFIGAGRWATLRRRAAGIEVAWRKSTSVAPVEEPAARS